MSHEPLRVLLWAPRGAGEHYHGPGSFAYRLYSLADPADLEVSLVHGKPEQASYDLFAQQHGLGRAESVFGLPAFLWKSKKWLRAHHGDFDVFHALSGYQSSVSPAYEAERLGLPAALFIAAHGRDLADKPGVKRLIGLPARRRRLIRRLSAVVAMSTAIYRELRSYDVPADRIVRIPLGVNTTRFRPATDPADRRQTREMLDLPPERFTVLFVGALAAIKRPLLLVEAMARLHPREDVQLVVVGPQNEPGYSGTVTDAIGSLGLEGRVFLRPYATEIEQYFRAADVFALPSASEGMPAAMVEAMASGLPVVGTGVSGIEDLIEHGTNGSIVEPNAQSLAEALQHYLDDPRLLAEHGARSRRRALDRYDARAVLNAHRALFRGMLAGTPAAASSTLPEME
ncbi:MAG: glycosyltransferase family 4 protein [Acidimicrobiia bacterium]|nr:glycosyltransferase family 4 protein [Acidimicrobiia bacterium]